MQDWNGLKHISAQKATRRQIRQPRKAQTIQIDINLHIPKPWGAQCKDISIFVTAEWDKRWADIIGHRQTKLFIITQTKKAKGILRFSRGYLTLWVYQLSQGTSPIIN